MKYIEIPLDSGLAKALRADPPSNTDLWLVLKAPGLGQKSLFRAQISAWSIHNDGVMGIDFRSFNEVAEDWATARGI